MPPPRTKATVPDASNKGSTTSPFRGVTVHSTVTTSPPTGVRLAGPGDGGDGDGSARGGDATASRWVRKRRLREGPRSAGEARRRGGPAPKAEHMDRGIASTAAVANMTPIMIEARPRKGIYIAIIVAIGPCTAAGYGRPL